MGRPADEPDGWLRDTVESNGGIVYEVRTRPDLAVEYLSHTVQDIADYRSEDFVANPALVATVITAADAATLAQALALEPGEHAEVELRWIHRDGSTVWLRHRSQAVARGDGSVAVRGMAFNVTDARTAQSQLAESEERFRMLAENASDFVLMAGPEGLVTWISPSVQSALGWRPDQVIGRDAMEFLHPSLQQELPRWREQIAAGLAVSGRSQLLCADGSYRWFARTLRGLWDADGTLIGRITGFTDITAEVEAEHELAQRERAARDLAENSADVVVRTTREGVIDWVSPSVERALGWLPEQMIGQPVLTFLHSDFHPDVRGYQQRVNAGEALRGRLRALRQDGAYQWFDWHAKPVFDDTGRVVARVSGWRDISAEVEYEQRLATSERRYRLLAENSSDVVFLGDTQAVLEWVSPSIREVLGWDPEELVGQPVASLLHPQDVPVMRTASGRANVGQRARYEARFRCSDDTYRWMAISLRPVTNADGVITGRVAAAQDIEAEMGTRLDLARSEERFRTALESAPAGMAVVSADRRFLKVNPALCRLLERDETWLTGRGIGDVLDPPDDELDRQMRAELSASGQRSLTREHQMVRSDRERIWVEHSMGVVRDDTGTITSFVCQFIDVTEARHYRERLRFLASHDPLTELMNRREVFARVEALLSQQSADAMRLAVLFIDLDGLKPLNDRFGHVIGDEVIRTVAGRIRSNVRPSDLVARYGGDEFVVVLPAVDSIDTTVAAAAELHAAARAPMWVAGEAIAVTLSIGVALARPDDDPDSLLSRADAALYEAKSDGRDRTVVCAE